MKNGVKPKPVELLPYDTILAARSNDAEAIELVLKHFDAYIAELATRRKRNEYGRMARFTDPDFIAALHEKLLSEITNWKELI